jgi:tetratricopeptide (TPR) repeat protein
LPDRPGIGGGGNRPSFPDRPNIGGGDNNNIINRPNRPIGRPIRPPDRPIYINNRTININNIRPGSRPWYDYHFHHWHRGYWSWWRPAGWFVGGVGAGWLLAPSQPIIVYSNPFYDKSVTVFNYSQALPPPPADPVNDAESLDAAESAVEIFEQAREAFGKGDFKDALALVDKAIKALPTDATLHEFRALSLFALKDYRQAAASLYAVLAAGPGWDWETMKYLYPDVSTYTEQLRALESYQKANPKSAEASFVLAYHYLVLGHVDAAIKQMENVVKLLPESQLSTELLAALKGESSRPSPG